MPTGADEPTVRRARRADADKVFPLTCELARSFTPERAAFDASFPDLVVSANTHVLVAEVGDGIVGYLLGFDHLALFANGRLGWIEELVVDADRRGRGVGRALVSAFEAELTGVDARAVALATTRAGPFYEALGYAHHAAYYRKVFDGG